MKKELKKLLEEKELYAKEGGSNPHLQEKEYESIAKNVLFIAKDCDNLDQEDLEFIDWAEKILNYQYKD